MNGFCAHTALLVWKGNQAAAAPITRKNNRQYMGMAVGLVKIE